MRTKRNPIIVDASTLLELVPGVWVITDRFIPLVPNVAIIEGKSSVLVFETGLGPRSGKAVLEKAQEIAGRRDLLLTISHFHPEHGFGAQEFKGVAHIVYNELQRMDLLNKGQQYLTMFTDFGPNVADALEGTVLVEPDETYSGFTSIDLGGRSVELIEVGQAHTLGDQLVWLPQDKIVFAGDLLENNVFPIFPYAPPGDVDVDGNKWIDALRRIRGLNPTWIVPGHGKISDNRLLDTVENYMLDLGSKVQHYKNLGLDEQGTAAILGPVIQESHPEWREPNWVEPAIRCFYHSGFSR